MMDEQDGDAVSVGQPLEDGEVSVVIGIGVLVVGSPDHLEGVDDDQDGVRVFCKEGFELLFQSTAQQSGLGGEVNGGRRVLGNVQQPVLDTELGVLQTEIEGSALLRWPAPDAFAFGDLYAEPQGQPGLAHLGRPGQDVESLGEQRVHDKGQRHEGLGHQCDAVNGVELLIQEKTSFAMWLALASACVRIQRRNAF